MCDVAWASTKALEGAQFELASAAIQRLSQFTAPIVEASAALEVGASTDCAAASSIAGDAAPLPSDRVLKRARAANDELRKALEGAVLQAESAEEAEHLASWIEALEAGGSVIPPQGFEHACLSFENQALRDQKFVRRCPIERTEPAVHPEEQQELPPGVSVSSKSDILTDRAIRRIADFLKAMRAWHRARLRGEECQRPQPLALGKDAFKGE
eukprot:1835244-Prymnesium_polylepis.1